MSSRLIGYAPIVLCFLFVWRQGILRSQTPLKLATGKEVYQAACVACHGADGKGQPQTTLGFEPPETFPDFTDCNTTTREANADWQSIIHNGGPARGFSEIMPSFKEALTADQIDMVIGYVRGFCREPAWPRGELNLPRALFTEKAFPEDEAVLQTAIDTKSPRNISHRLVYEQRFGIRDQFEMIVPFGLRREGSSRFGGIGDVAFGYKRMLASSLRTGSIFSASGEIKVPTGDKSRGFGAGATVFEGFAAYGQLLPRDAFLQVQGGFELPTNRRDAPRALFWRTAAGVSRAGNGGFGRLWSPMVELIADREFGASPTTNWDVAPQMQVTLNKRQHIRLNFGVRLPVNNTLARSAQIAFYLLWDRFDGGLRAGW
jgi:hypothetical protein